MLKKILITLAVIITLILSFAGSGAYWLSSLMPNDTDINKLKATQKTDIPYLQKSLPANRGKILAVVTSEIKIGETKKKTGYELTELSRAYWVFTANGFTVDIASPKGGEPRKVLDGDDMGMYDYAFLNDASAQDKITNTLKVENVSAKDYQAVYFVGGKGAMFDFPDNIAIQQLAKNMYQDNKVVSAVCHGPAALVNVKLDNGDWLVKNSQVSAFTNDEELFLIPEAETIFPFLLQDKLMRRGANFISGSTYLNQVSQDKHLITGQNPWSVWTLSEAVIKKLGYTPVNREHTPEENSIDLLMTYEKNGYEQAKSAITDNKREYQKMVIVMHSVVAFIKMEINKAVELLLLANTMNN